MVNKMEYFDYITSYEAECGVLWAVRLRRRPKTVHGKWWYLVLQSQPNYQIDGYKMICSDMDRNDLCIRKGLWYIIPN